MTAPVEQDTDSLRGIRYADGGAQWARPCSGPTLNESAKSTLSGTTLKTEFALETNKTTRNWGNQKAAVIRKIKAGTSFHVQSAEGKTASAATIAVALDALGALRRRTARGGS